MGGQVFQELVAETLTVTKGSNLGESDLSAFRRKSSGSGTEFWHLAGGLPPSTVSGGSAAFANNVLTTFAFFTGKGGQIDRLAFRVGGAIATARARVGVYLADPVSFIPTSLLAETGDQDASAVAVVATAVNITLPPDQVVWFALVTGTAAPSLSILAGTLGFLTPFGANAALAVVQIGWTVAFAYAALPALFPAGPTIAAVANVPVLACRFGS